MAKTDRATMESALIEAGVAKWGEEERAGVARMVRAKSLATVRAEYADLRGDKEESDRLDSIERAKGVMPAWHACDDGVS